MAGEGQKDIQKGNEQEIINQTIQYGTEFTLSCWRFTLS
jgi:hypothetical protein